jgi:hypothetical protein
LILPPDADAPRLQLLKRANNASDNKEINEILAELEA